MSELLRFGVSIEQDLLENFDRLIEERGYATRSESIRDLIREALISRRLDLADDSPALGSLTLVYDHHARSLAHDLGAIQHDFHEIILSVMHLHVSHDDCLEIIALRGTVARIEEFSNRLLSLKGIKNGKLFLTLPSSNIAG